MPRTRIIDFLVALAILIPLTACGKSPEDARVALGQMGISYTADAFVEVAGKGDTVAVGLFLDAGMKPDTPGKKGMTALMLAALNGHTSIVQVLLDKGADVNAKDKDGGTALMFAAKGGHTEVVELLKQAGARE